MRTSALLFAAILVVPSTGAAQAPSYLPEFLGSAIPGRINLHGEVIGRTTVAGAMRAVVMKSGQAPALLPLPAGMLSSSANDLNDDGAVVGRAGPVASSTEFNGRAVAWVPDGAGGYTAQFLGALPGQTIGSATAINNRGDIVGWSSNGTFRYPVYFRGPGDVVDLTATGIFDPVDLNESRVLVDQSFTAKRLDLDDMVAENLGVPSPPGGPSYMATRASAINETGQVAASAILATSTSCDRQAARFADGPGWQTFTLCGANDGATDINDLGDIVMLATIAPRVRFEGGGNYLVEDLIVNTVGHWYAVTTSAGWINNARQIVIYATNSTTGQTGTLLLNPEQTVDVPPAGARAGRPTLAVEPNPFRAGTRIRFALPSPGPVTLGVYDTAGRRVRTLLDERRAPSGPGEFTWDGRDDGGGAVPQGLYFVRLGAGPETLVGRLARVR